ncbi:MAG: type II toxin-antitoxin system antitoxin SocA domain-containing protein [Thermodesulfobacteriota bacterium]
MANVDDVAAFIQERTGPLSAYKLQKLVYYAQAWSLAWTGNPLFREKIKAWVDGPVVPQLWHNRRNGQHGDPSALTMDQAETVSAVLDFYETLSPAQLIELSHHEEPWRKAREGLSPRARGNREITPQSMIDFYRPAATGEKVVPDAVRRGVVFLLAVPEHRLDEPDDADDVDANAVIDWLESGEDDPWQDDDK